MDLITYAIIKNYITSALEDIDVGSRGKSAFDIAKENGYEGTISDWLDSLKGSDGVTPHIGDNGNWFIGDVDTGVAATGSDSSIGNDKIILYGGSAENAVEEEDN